MTMTVEPTVLVAAAVLLVTVPLIFREYLRVRKPRSGEADTGAGFVASDEADDELDVTKIAPSVVRQLPRLAGAESIEETAGGGSAAVTLFEPGTENEEPTGQSDLILVTAAAQSDTGQRRKKNEDAYFVDEDRSIFVVADGMGGHSGGAVASQLAVDSIDRALAGGPLETPQDGLRPPQARELVAAIEAANARIREQAAKQPDLHDMGTTVVAARFARRKRRAFIAHVGDSRCYRLRGGELKLLTSDHTLGEKGVTGALSGYVRRALGVRRRVKVDVVVDCPRTDDLYLLCSDGLNKMLPDEEARALLERGATDLSRTATSLVQAANDRGGKDNVTVVLIGVRSPRKGHGGTVSDPLASP